MGGRVGHMRALLWSMGRGMVPTTDRISLLKEVVGRISFTCTSSPFLSPLLNHSQYTFRHTVTEAKKLHLAISACTSGYFRFRSQAFYGPFRGNAGRVPKLLPVAFRFVFPL